MSITSENPTILESITNGGASILALSYFKDLLKSSTIWIILALTLIFTDLFFGIEASRARGEEIRLSRAIRRTITKICEYFCWIMVSISASVAFEQPMIYKAIFGLVYGTEGISCLKNWFASFGKTFTFDLKGFLTNKVNDGFEYMDIKDNNDNNDKKDKENEREIEKDNEKVLGDDIEK